MLYGHRRFRSTICALSILLLTQGAARAADTCFDTGLTLVLKSFSLPAKGKCKTFRGFYLLPDTSLLSWLNGSACASTDDTQITFLGNGFAPGGSVQYTDHFVLPRTTLTTSLTECYTNGSPCITVPISLIECTPKKVPVP
jgi:hypothetical protein